MCLGFMPKKGRKQNRNDDDHIQIRVLIVSTNSNILTKKSKRNSQKYLRRENLQKEKSITHLKHQDYDSGQHHP